MKPFIIIGAGGHAKVVIDLLRCLGHEVLGLSDRNPALKDKEVMGVKVLGSDDCLLQYEKNQISLALGLGFSGADLKQAVDRRFAVYRKLSAQGYDFPALIHPKAVVAESCQVSSATQIMANATLQAQACIGAGAIINTNASIDHDCKIGNGVHIGPSATLGGDVVVGDLSFIGLGSSVIQSLTIGQNVLISAGSVVVRSLTNGQVVKGIPAR